MHHPQAHHLLQLLLAREDISRWLREEGVPEGKPNEIWADTEDSILRNLDFSTKLEGARTLLWLFHMEDTYLAEGDVMEITLVINEDPHEDSESAFTISCLVGPDGSRKWEKRCWCYDDTQALSPAFKEMYAKLEASHVGVRQIARFYLERELPKP